MTKDTDFALHGGTAINFFVRDMPRLSVDIDLTYLRISPREERTFLMSFKEKAPKWDLLGVEGAQDMPAVKWKLANLEKMNDDKHKKAVQQLKRVIAKD